jgi:D-tyrosyl-tRNA(Tyr) deacylase
VLALIQRVSEACVRVEGQVVGEIGTGLLVLVCAERGDGEEQCERLLERLLKLRCFADELGRMNRSLRDVSGGLLIVPQFTLAADTRSGTRPSFTAAAPPDEGRRLFDHFVTRARQEWAPVGCGVFGADMKVSLVNDGPVTLWLKQPPAGVVVAQTSS